MNEDHEGNAARPLVDELLDLPSEGWDDWFASHPEARTEHVLQELVRIAEKNPPDALTLTDFVLRHVDSIEVPAAAKVPHGLLCADTWRIRAIALRHAGDEDGALQALERASAIRIAALVPFPQPPVTEDDIRRAKELSEQYGWERLLEKIRKSRSRGE